MNNQSLNRLLKIGVVFALVLGVVAVGLLGGQRSTLAHEVEHQTFVIHAGAHGPGSVEVLAFAPTVVQVHQGDSVMWHIASFHNIHFEDQAAEFAIFPIVDGQPVPQINPDVAFPTIENGASFTGGSVNSGLPGDDPIFSLVIDAPVGRYAYFCDIHPGMVGVIEVVADDVAIPSAGEVELEAEKEFGEQFNQAFAAQPGLAANAATQAVDGVLEVTLGSGDTGRATINQINSYTGIIQAGESVTWTNPSGSIEAHFINSLPYDEEALPDIIPQPQDDAPPVLSIGPGFLGTTPDGSVVNAGDSFNSAFINPGQSYTLTFNDPGVYMYFCHIHPGMNGVIVVQ